MKEAKQFILFCLFFFAAAIFKVLLFNISDFMLDFTGSCFTGAFSVSCAIASLEFIRKGDLP